MLFQQDGQDKSVCLWGLGRSQPRKNRIGPGPQRHGACVQRNGGRTFRRQSRRNTAVAVPPQACPSGHAVRPGPETNKSFVQQRPSLRNHAVSILQRSGSRGSICPCKKCSLPDAGKEHVLPLFRIVQAIYSSAISRATKTPLAEAWDREWVTPLPSPITYSPG